MPVSDFVPKWHDRANHILSEAINAKGRDGIGKS